MKQSKSYKKAPVVGITGGAGSGKSTVVKWMCDNYDVLFLHCDKIAHKLMEPGGESYNNIVEYFGKEILNEDKTINRIRLSEIVYESREKLDKLNDMTHPAVKKFCIEKIKAAHTDNYGGIILIEAALLLEAGFDDICDTVWYIHAPLEDRKKRLKRERGYSDEKIAGLIKSQLDEQNFLKRTDACIENPDMDEEKQQASFRSQIGKLVGELY